MTLELFTAFIIYACVTAITPGPNNMMCLASGLNYGIKRTLPHIAGIGFGFAVLVFLAGVGLLSILDYFPAVYHVLRVLSILYLLYLSWKIATAAPLSNDANKKGKPMGFWQAVAFQWVNPKGLIMAIAAVTNYIPDTPGSAFFFNVVLVSTAFGVVSFLSSGTWSVFGLTLRRFLNNPRYYRIFNVTMAVLLVLSILPMVWEMISQAAF